MFILDKTTAVLRKIHQGAEKWNYGKCARF